MNRKIIGNILILLGLLLIVAAAALVVQNVMAQEEAETSAQQVLVQLEIPEVTVPAAIENEAPVPVQIPDYQLNPQMPMPETVIDGVAYIGTLEIPELELNLPIISTTTKANLRIAPCRFTSLLGIFSNRLVYH